MGDSQQRKLQDRVAIITGAGNGIGRGTAIAMAEEGAIAVIADIDMEGSRLTEEEIKRVGGKALVIQTDISDGQERDRLVSTVLGAFDRIDILINNAGINVDRPEGSLLQTTEEDVRRIFDTNFFGPLFLTQRVAQEMIEQGTQGAILFTSSVHSQVIQLRAAYPPSKAAIESLVREAAVQLGMHGIRVNGVSPGPIAIRGQGRQPSADMPVGYGGIPEDNASAMVFLACAPFVTGQIIVVDGGFSHISYRPLNRDKYL